MVSFEQSEQQLKVIVNIEMVWRDEYLTWDPAQHSGVDILFVPAEKIWKYDLTLYSAVGKQLVEMDHDVVIVRPDGMVTWFSSAMLYSSCLVRVRYFPFDRQYCRLILASWTHDNTSVTLKQTNETVRKEYFINNGVWDLTNIGKEYQVLKWECCPNPWIEAHYLLLFQRQSRYYVITVIVPSTTLSLVSLLVFFMPPDKFYRQSRYYVITVIVPSTTLSLVSLLVFFMPPDSEEKVTLASSNLLAMLLFQELVSTSMPPIGNQFPLIGSFFVASIVINTFSIFTSILIMYLHNKDNRPVPTWLKKLAVLKTGSQQSQPVQSSPTWVKRRLSGFICASTVSKAVQVRHAQDSGQNAIDTNQISSKYLTLSTVPETKIKKQEDKASGNPNADGANPSLETREEIIAQWQELSMKVNRIMAFLLTSSVMLTALVILFLYIAQEEGDFPART
ncbi:neuronal acetylcholine receptor subunit alpha-9-like [Strongylocentrotus purpuratus]|uniref:Uncharacterized protein n=1 Tax=Strongylocentrotus purpuratus TaxID=7668 RepID=A0A7M7NII0_STRPU|nr:neuronal acetylcholine receptor subunit alpha-9-like [Strongylocentrotus purpuratus]